MSALFPIFFLFLAGALILWGVFRFPCYYYTRRLLHLSLLVENLKVSRGGTLKFKVKLDPSRDVVVNRWIATLRCIQTELIRNQEGLGMTRLNEVLDEYQAELAADMETFKKGEVRCLDGEFPVPPGVMLTDHVGDLTRRWYLGIEAHLPSPPPATVEQEVWVADQAVSPGDASSLFQGKPSHAPAGRFTFLEIDAKKKSKE